MKITKRRLRRLILEYISPEQREKNKETLAAAIDLEPNNPDRPDEEMQYVKNLDDGKLYRLPSKVAKHIDTYKRDRWQINKQKLKDDDEQWVIVNKLLGTSNWEWSGMQGNEYGDMNDQRRRQEKAAKWAADPEGEAAKEKYYDDLYAKAATDAGLDTVSGKVKVEWDLGDTEFEDMPYEQGVKAAGLPAVVKLPGEFEEGELDDWLSDEYGFTHFGWEPIKESRMRITKRQLRRIIKEEKARLLQEMQGPEPRGRVPDNLTAQVELQNGTTTGVEIPYYIIEDAIADGLSWDGTFVEIEEYIDDYTGWPVGSWQFTQETLDTVRRLVP